MRDDAAPGPLTQASAPKAPGRLGVVSPEVGHTSRRQPHLQEAPRWEPCQAEVRPLVVVVTQKSLERKEAVLARVEDLYIKALAEHGANPALNLAVGLRAVG